MKTLQNHASRFTLHALRVTFCALLYALCALPLSAQTRPEKDVVVSYSSWIYKAHVDSTVGADTSVYNFEHEYLKGYITVYNQNGSTPDTVIIEHYSYAKGGWTSLAIGLKDVLSGSYLTDNALIPVAAVTSKTYEISLLRPGYVRIRPKVINGRAATRKLKVTFVGVN